MNKRDRPPRELILPEILAQQKAAEVESPVVEESPKTLPQRFDPMTDDEIAEYQRYWIELEAGSGGHRPDISIPAGQGLVLIEILKELRKR